MRVWLAVGAFAIYLEPWHADILPFLELKKNTGIEEERARDLFYGLWINDLFMKVRQHTRTTSAEQEVELSVQRFSHERC